MLGERFGSFKAVAKLGAGSMGEVYLAEHQRIDRRAAIKVLLAELTRDAHAVRRLFSEARAASLIRHPGIVEVFDCDVHRNGRAYIVMEYLQGETLGVGLENAGALPWARSCRIGRCIADAIGAAHAKGIIHRDIKPENVFLTSERDPPAPGEVKVLDFGFAKLMEGTLVGGMATSAGSIIGSPAYMSPEVCEGGPVDHRSDVYSLGCLLFEMIAGVPPFRGESVRYLLAAHRSERPPSLSEWMPETPAWLGGLLARMLAKAPQDRPQSMCDVAAGLAAADAHDAPGASSGPRAASCPRLTNRSTMD